MPPAAARGQRGQAGGGRGQRGTAAHRAVAGVHRPGGPRALGGRVRHRRRRDGCGPAAGPGHGHCPCPGAPQGGRSAPLPRAAAVRHGLPGVPGPRGGLGHVLSRQGRRHEWACPRRYRVCMCVCRTCLHASGQGDGRARADLVPERGVAIPAAPCLCLRARVPWHATRTSGDAAGPAGHPQSPAGEPAARAPRRGAADGVAGLRPPPLCDRWHRHVPRRGGVGGGRRNGRGAWAVPCWRAPPLVAASAQAFFLRWSGQRARHEACRRPPCHRRCTSRRRPPTLLSWTGMCWPPCPRTCGG